MGEQIDFTWILLCFIAACIVISCVAIGAYLVIEGHPGFGILAMLIAMSVRIKGIRSSSDDGNDK